MGKSGPRFLELSELHSSEAPKYVVGSRSVSSLTKVVGARHLCGENGAMVRWCFSIPDGPSCSVNCVPLCLPIRGALVNLIIEGGSGQ